MRKIEVGEIDLLDPVTKEKYQSFTKIFEKVTGTWLSHHERDEKKLESTDFTYGEIEFCHFLPLLIASTENYKTKGKFYDLGCGTGKVLLAAAFSELFNEICGIEYLESLAKAASEVCDKYKLMYKNSEISFNVLTGDILENDWSDADFIYIASLCFSEKVMLAITEKGKLLKKGTRILSLKPLNDEKIYKLLYCFKVKMSWGLTDVYLFERN